MAQPEKHAEFLVACLCAAWCGTCKEYEAGFMALRERFPDAGFVWVDVEDASEVAGDVEVENFPTIVIQRAHDVLFCGTMLPQHRLLERLLETLIAQTPDESAAYARGNAERLSWQGMADIRSRLSE